MHCISRTQLWCHHTFNQHSSPNAYLPVHCIQHCFLQPQALHSSFAKDSVLSDKLTQLGKVDKFQAQPSFTRYCPRLTRTPFSILNLIFYVGICNCLLSYLCSVMINEAKHTSFSSCFLDFFTHLIKFWIQFSSNDSMSSVLQSTSSMSYYFIQKTRQNTY